MQNLNWNNIRSLNSSQKDGFEELVCQLARNDSFENSKSFTRKGTPDAGVECLWQLNDATEICYQAKFFTSPLTSTQWGEIDDSVKTLLEKHPKVVKYIISIPQDRADARVPGRKSFLDKWNECDAKWKRWASEKNLSVEFIYEGTSELLNKLSKPENIGKTLFWFNKNEYSNEWFIKKNKRRIHDLNERYSPEINVNSNNKYIFDGLYLNNHYLQTIEVLISKALKQFLELIRLCNNQQVLQNNLKKLNTLLQVNIKDVDVKNSKKFGVLKNVLNNTCTLLSSYEERFFRTISHKGERENLTKELHILTDKFHDAFSSLQNFDTQLAENPFLIIEGEAGMGKSHLIADVITEKLQHNQYSLLLLGQHFTDGDIWTQIKNQLEIKESKEEFLGALNSKSESLGSRIIIFIDALNEGEGKYLWKEQLSGFLQDIKEFQNIGLVLTVRSTYKDLVFPEKTFDEIPNFKHTVPKKLEQD